MRPRPHRCLALLAAALLAGCGAVDVPCGPGQQPVAADLLYFGSSRPDGPPVTQEQWDAFLADVVTPRYPSGFTAWPATGQWQGAGGAITREASWVLSIVHPDEPQPEEGIRAIATQYKARFRQEAVLRVKQAACMSL
jgi:hypothetical protein